MTPDFINNEISIKPLDYYYTNPIARSSKVMNECRTISKNLSFTESSLPLMNINGF